MADEESKTYAPPRKRERTPPVLVYFVQAEVLRLIKIGVASHMEMRLPSLQCGSPDRLRLIGVIYTDDAVTLEKKLHKRFWRYREHGEWFCPNVEVLAFIRGNAGDLVEPEQRVATFRHSQRMAGFAERSGKGLRRVAGQKAALAAYKEARGIQ